MICGLIHKFGLGHCDLPTMIWNVGMLFRLLALNIDSRYKPIPILICLCTVFASLCYFYIYCFCVIWFVFWYCPQKGDTLSAIVIFAMGTNSWISTNKLLFMYYYRQEIRKIVDDCLSSISRVVPNSRFANNILKNLRVVKKRAIILWTVIMGSGVTFIIKPLLKSGKRYPEDSFVLYALRPMDVSPNYEINLFVQNLATMFTCFLAASITIFLILVTGYIEAQMLALSEEQTMLWDDAVEHYKVNRDIETRTINIEEERKVINAYVTKNLENMIRIHASNLNLLRKVDDIFRNPIGIEFTLVVIGLTTELLGGLENNWLGVPYILMLVGTDCLIGQRVIDANMTFEQAVYDCNWENFDATNRKIVLLMLLNAENTLKLSAAGVTELSFKSFMTVIKFIYTAYTTLRSTVH